MDGAAQRRHVVLQAHLVGQLQEAHEHGRHHLRVRDLVLGHQRQEFLGVEMLHDHRRAAELHDRHVEAQRGRVIERRRREIDRVLAHAVELAGDLEQRVVGVDRLRLDHRQHALGPAGGAGRIEHVVAGGFVGDALGGLAGHCLFPRLIAGDGAVQHVAVGDALHQWRELGRLVGEIFRGDEELRAAVSHDVIDFSGGQPRADGGVDQARALGAPADLEEARVVLEEQRDVVAGPEARGTEKLRDAVGLIVELPVGHRLAGRGHDVGGLVRMRLGVDVGMHARGI